MSDIAAAVADVSPAGTFLSWGILSIQLGNLIVIVTMLAVFALVLVLPFPGGRRRR